MSGLRKLTMSFAGGEVTPEFWGQIGDAKFQSGLATCRNMIVLPHGPVANRPGFAYVNTAKTPAKRTRVLPFTYSTTQTMVLEFGDQYVRFHTQGATLRTDGTLEGFTSVKAVYEVATPYLEADLFDLHFVQSADVLTVCHPGYAPRELKRLGLINWTLTAISFVPSLSVPAGVTAIATLAASPTNLVAYSYAVTSVGATGLEESAVSTAATGPVVSITAATNANPGVVTTGANHNLVVGQPVTIAGVLGMAQINGAWTVNTVPTSTSLTLALNGVPVNTTAFGVYTSGGTLTPTGVVNNLLQTGAYNTIAWTTTGATRYNVYKQSNGLFGYIGQTDSLTFKDDNITANLGKTPPITNNPFNAAGYYPGAVSYFEQRRCFAGSTNEPQNLRMTRSGTESNLTYSIPTRDDDSINIRVAAREANTIRHIVPLQNLVLLTGAAEWRVTSINSDAITPSSISVKPQSYIGANNAQPLIVNNNILYAAARGGHLREMAYAYQAGGYITGDLSLRAPHLFDAMDIVDMAYSKAPQPLVWAVSSGGKLLGLTYVPEQQVGAWHQHDTDGTFESCCVVAEGGEDVLYTVVKRLIGGSYTRFIERMHTRQFATLADAFFVDAGATYVGAPTTTVSSMAWLEGKTVSVLGDGAVFPQKVVTGGAITLEQPCSTIQAGLPITADVQTLPLSAQIDASYGQGRLKNINKIWLRVYRSSGVFAGPSLDRLVQFKQRTTEVYGAPPALKTDELEISLEPSWQQGGQIYVRQSDPLPLTLVSLTVEAALGG